MPVPGRIAGSIVAGTMTMPHPAHIPAGQPACYRHPDRPTYVSCTRCGRPGCPECLRSAAVGQQCVDCVQAGVRSMPQPTTVAGATIRTGTPVMSYGLIATNVAVFLMQLATPALTPRFALQPLAVAKADQFFRLFSSAFMHYGIVHILFNMYALYVLGPPLERHLGRLRFTSLYLLSALGGSVAVYLFSDPRSATVGASGAIFGLFGATAVAYKRFNLDMRWLIGLIVVNLVLTFSIPNISWQGHMGGVVTGALVAAAYIYAPRASRTVVQAGATVGLLVVFAVLIAARTAMLAG